MWEHISAFFFMIWSDVLIMFTRLTTMPLITINRCFVTFCLSACWGRGAPILPACWRRCLAQNIWERFRFIAHHSFGPVSWPLNAKASDSDLVCCLLWKMCFENFTQFLLGFFPLVLWCRFLTSPSFSCSSLTLALPSSWIQPCLSNNQTTRVLGFSS